jgi:hypothetical protein
MRTGAERGDIIRDAVWCLDFFHPLHLHLWYYLSEFTNKEEIQKDAIRTHHMAPKDMPHCCRA